METNHTRLVGTDDGPGLDLGPNPGIGNARGIREGIGEEPVVGRTIERGIGIPGRGTRTGLIGVEPTGRVVRTGMEEGVEALTVPWRNGWVSEPLALHPFRAIQTNNRGPTIRYLWVNLHVRSASVDASDCAFLSLLSQVSLVLVIHASLTSVSVSVLSL